MASKFEPSWIENKKERFNDIPWMEVRGPTMYGEVMHRQVIKSWQWEASKDFARFMVRAWMGEDDTQVDYGDEYVREVLKGALVKVLGEAPTPEQMKEWAALQDKVFSKPDPMDSRGW